MTIADVALAAYGVTGTATGTVSVEECDIRWYAWGTGGPPLVLIHGGGAHCGWWLATVAALGPCQRVIAMDYSGHGDSGIRAAYSIRAWSEEVAAVVAAVADGPAVLVAHSMGGRAATVAAARHRELVTALVLVESIVPTRSSEPMPAAALKRVYPGRHEAVAQFRLLPASDDIEVNTVRQLAEMSIRPVAGGWTWKFDPAVFRHGDAALVNHAIRDIACPVVSINGADSPVTRPSDAHALEQQLGRQIEYLTVPGGGHHLMVDNPAAMAEILTASACSQPRAAH